MKSFVLGIVAAVAVSASASVNAQSYDADPTVGFAYGSGNDYLPANAVVLTSASGGVTTSEIATRFHEPFVAAAATGGTGVYTFETGSNLSCSSATAGSCSDISFDFSFFGSAITGATITVTNLLTGGDATFLAALLGTVNTSGALQGSQRFSFGFLNGTIDPNQDIDFNPNVDSTFRIDLTGGGQTVSAFAQLGAGGQIAAVPEPATWAMMLIGFGAMGVSLRRRRRAQHLLQAA